jgi:hypothetical protein
MGADRPLFSMKVASYSEKNIQKELQNHVQSFAEKAKDIDQILSINSR